MWPTLERYWCRLYNLCWRWWRWCWCRFWWYRSWKTKQASWINAAEELTERLKLECHWQLLLFILTTCKQTSFIHHKRNKIVLAYILIPYTLTDQYYYSNIQWKSKYSNSNMVIFSNLTLSVFSSGMQSYYRQQVAFLAPLHECHTCNVIAGPEAASQEISSQDISAPPFTYRPCQRT